MEKDKLQELKDFRNAMIRVAEFQIEMKNADYAGIGARLIDWEYIKEWADNLCPSKEEK